MATRQGPPGRSRFCHRKPPAPMTTSIPGSGSHRVQKGGAGAALLEGAQLAVQLETFATAFDGCDRRAVVSMWFYIDVAALLPPLFAADTFGGPALRAELDTARVLFAPHDSCAGLVLPGAAPAPGDPCALCAPTPRPSVAAHRGDGRTGACRPQGALGECRGKPPGGRRAHPRRPPPPPMPTCCWNRRCCPTAVVTRSPGTRATRQRTTPTRSDRRERSRRVCCLRIRHRHSVRSLLQPANGAECELHRLWALATHADRFSRRRRAASLLHAPGIPFAEKSVRRRPLPPP